MELFGLYIAEPSRIICVPLFLFGIGVVIRHVKVTRKAVASLVHTRHLKDLVRHFSPARLWSKALLLCGVLIFLFLAFIRIQWGQREQTVTQEGRDVVIVLDVSRSMLAADQVPSRLEFAKLKIRELLNLLSAERVALILFSGSAYVQCPLTSDHGAFITFLKHVDAESISSGTTALDKAFMKTLEVFSSSQKRKNKLMVLLTDGEDFSANFGVIKSKALKEGINVFALGIGSPEGAPVPIVDKEGTTRGHEMDEHGKPVLSCLNEDLLQGICDTLGGTYVRSTQSDRDLETIVNKIHSYEKEKFEDRQFKIYEDTYFYFLGCAWLLLLLEWVL